MERNEPNTTEQTKPKPKMPVAESTVGVGSSGIDWDKLKPVSVSYEDSVTDARKNDIWKRLYDRAGLSSGSEKERQEIRLGVYAYCCKNGTSREGSYEGEFQTASGKIVPASIIPQAATRMHIRKFMRANMMDSYEALKKSKIMEEDGRFIAKAGALGIAPEAAFAMADWLTDCPNFTPSEARAHDLSFTRSIDRARRARDGNSLEAVEEGRSERNMRAQGPGAEAQGNPVKF